MGLGPRKFGGRVRLVPQAFALVRQYLWERHGAAVIDGCIAHVDVVSPCALVLVVIALCRKRLCVCGNLPPSCPNLHRWEIVVLAAILAYGLS